MDTGLLACNTYHYRLEAVDAAGRKSSYTSIKSVTVGGQGCGGGFVKNECFEGSDYRAIGQQGPEEVTYSLVYYHVDHLGSPRLVTNSNGAVIAKAALFPFGEMVHGSNPDRNTHWFTGHERDEITETDYMLARHYSFITGRFFSPDPSFVNAGLNAGTWSLNVYVNNDPVGRYDPTGLGWVKIRPLWPEWLFNELILRGDCKDCYHPQFFYDDGSPDFGLFIEGIKSDPLAKSPYYKNFKYLDDTYLHIAENVIRQRKAYCTYKVGWNCQNFAEQVLKLYNMAQWPAGTLLRECVAGDVDACLVLKELCASGRAQVDICREYERKKASGQLPAHQEASFSLHVKK